MINKLPVTLILLLGILTTLGYSQAFQDPFREPDHSTLQGGIGMTWIDGQPYTTITIAPDIAIGKFGVGVYLQFLMDNNNDFKLRKDEYKGGAGIFRAIRYIRYGHKYDPFYARLGTLDRASLANGFLVWNYNNGSNYDKRKVGLVADVDLGKYGIETLNSNFDKLELVGANLYFRPFRFMQNPLPILKQVRVYTTYVYDDNVSKLPPPSTSTSIVRAYGFGTDIQWLNLPVLKSFIYADYGKFVDYGNGKSVGISAIIPEFIGIFGVAARFEKRFLGKEFVPNFFGPLYELQRNLGALAALQSAGKREGYFGELSGHIVNRILLVGNYQRLNGVKGSGIAHLEASAPNLIPRIELRAYYDKYGIETFKDFHTLDYRSIATAEIGYQLNRFILVSTIYRWYWVEQTDEFGNIQYKPVERIEPRISFVYRF